MNNGQTGTALATLSTYEVPNVPLINLLAPNVNKIEEIKFWRRISEARYGASNGFGLKESKDLVEACAARQRETSVLSLTYAQRLAVVRSVGGLDTWQLADLKRALQVA